eukprot:284814554_6
MMTAKTASCDFSFYFIPCMGVRSAVALTRCPVQRILLNPGSAAECCMLPKTVRISQSIACYCPAQFGAFWRLRTKKLISLTATDCRVLFFEMLCCFLFFRGAAPSCCNNILAIVVELLDTLEFREFQKTHGNEFPQPWKIILNIHVREIRLWCNPAFILFCCNSTQHQLDAAVHRHHVRSRFMMILFRRLNSMLAQVYISPTRQNCLTSHSLSTKLQPSTTSSVSPHSKDDNHPVHCRRPTLQATLFRETDVHRNQHRHAVYAGVAVWADVAENLLGWTINIQQKLP